MTVRELRAYINKLPKEFDEYSLVNGEYGILIDDKDDKISYRKDMIIAYVTIDEENKEICFLHQTQDEVDDILNKHNG